MTRTLCTVAGALLVCATPLLPASLTPYGLEADGRTNPLAVEGLAPRLSWHLRSSVRGDRQTAYQIAVGTAAGRADLWDSGRVTSEETAWIPYQGARLGAFQRCFWKVRVWDAQGQPSAWSETAEWSTAAVSPGDWKAGWIAHPNRTLRSGPLPIFRKEFELDRKPVRAIAYVSGVGFHEFRVNGRKAGDHVLAPAWTDFHDTVLYEALDVTPLLRTGKNALGVMLGNGFYNIPGGRYTKFTASFGHPRLTALLRLEYENGTVREVVTDSTWRVTDGPLVFSCIYGGEDYDARLALPGWDEPGFDDSTWPTAVRVEPAGGALRPQTSPPVRVVETFRPVRVTEPKPGVRVYDLGQNFSGWPALAVSGAAGTTVRLIPGELLAADGTVNQRSSGAPVSFSYTLRGQNREHWEPRFTYYGFRYVQVEGSARIESIEGRFVHLDAARAGSFSCSKPLFNRIHKLVDMAIRSNMQHVLTDCPHREKLGWLEQTHLMGPSVLYGWDLRSFLPKIMRDMRESQTPEGLVPDIAPEYVVFSGGFRDSPEWGAAAVLVPWLAWEWYGDRAPLEQSYPMMKRYVEYLRSQLRDGLLWHGLGDWYDIGPGEPGASKLTPRGLTASAFDWEDLRVMQQASALLGHTEDAARFREEARAVEAAFQKEFYKPASKTYATGSQTALAIPFVMNLAPENARAQIVESLAADVRKHGNHPTAGDVGHRYLLKALLDAGRSDVVYEMASQTEAPSYGAQLAAGATSLTEAWDGNQNSSQNHFMLGHIEEWFYAGLAGVRPASGSPGFRKVVIRPEPVGDVTWAEGSYETVRGPVKVRWSCESGPFRVAVSLPPGASGEVHVPAQSRNRAAAPEGARFLREDGGRWVFEISSGDYEFVAK